MKKQVRILLFLWLGLRNTFAPVHGADSLTYKYKDADWLFATRANLEAFKASPEMYVPQYGGYCAYGTSLGHKAPTETDTWTILDYKLYFDYNMKVKNIWSKKREELIETANVRSGRQRLMTTTEGRKMKEAHWKHLDLIISH